MPFWGYAAAGDGNLDGDGRDDLVVGAPWTSGTYGYEGVAFVYPGCERVVRYVDADGDGFGSTTTGLACSDDADGSVDPSTRATSYADADGDGFGDSSQPYTSCDAAEGYVPAGTDCDDTRADVNPGAVEVCDDLDDDCDGEVDESCDDGGGGGGGCACSAGADGVDAAILPALALAAGVLARRRRRQAP